MTKKYGYVAFEERNVDEGTTLEEETIVYSNIIDSLRFCDIEKEKQIAKVSYENGISLPDDDYYGYYDMNLSNQITVEKIYKYEEVIDRIISSTSEIDLIKFIRSFRLEPSEKDRFKQISCFVWKAVEYFQENRTTIYDESSKKLVKEYGEYNNKRRKGE